MPRQVTYVNYANIVPLTLTNYSSGYGYPIGTNSSGAIQVPTNFRSKDKLLQYLKRYFGCLSVSNMPCSFYK